MMKKLKVENGGYSEFNWWQHNRGTAGAVTWHGIRKDRLISLHTLVSDDVASWKTHVSLKVTYQLMLWLSLFLCFPISVCCLDSEWAYFILFYDFYDYFMIYLYSCLCLTSTWLRAKPEQLNINSYIQSQFLEQTDVFAYLFSVYILYIIYIPSISKHWYTWLNYRL